MAVHMSYQPPRILLAEIYLGWVMGASPGRTLSQNDWPETNPKRIPSPKNLRLQTTRHSSSLGPFTPLRSTRGPIHNQVPCFVSMCISSPNSFASVQQQPTLWPWNRSPLPATYWTNKEKKGTADLTMLRMNNIPKGSLGFLRAKELNTLLLNILYSIWQLSNQRMTQQTKMLILHNLLPIRLP